MKQTPSKPSTPDSLSPRELSPGIRRTGPRLVRTLTLAALVAVVAAGCSPAGAATSAGGEGCVAGDVALTSLDTLDDPREWTGESTACIGSESVDAVSDTVEQQLPVTMIDSQGTEVTITDTSRILAVDLYGSLAATVFALGLGDQVVGRDISTGFDEAKDLPLVTQNGHELNGEAILDLAPTVILTDTSIGPWDVMLQMRDSGIPVVAVTPKRSLENTDEIVDTVATALGVPTQGELLKKDLTERIATTTQQIAEIAPDRESEKLRMLFLYVRGSAGIYYIFGADSGADSLITSLGGIDVATEIGWTGMKPMTAEALVDADPDLILMMTKGLSSVDGVDGLLEAIPAVAETSAGQNRRIVDMSDTQIMSFGPRSAAVLDALARAIYAPEQSGFVK